MSCFYIIINIKQNRILSGGNLKKIVLFIIIIVFVLTSLRFSQYYSKSCVDYANTGIKSDITMDINAVLAEDIEINNSEYENFIKIKYGNNNEITAIEIDSGKINRVSNNISSKISEKLINTNREYGIPLGNALGSKLFSGRGPKIGVNIIPIGTVRYEIKSELISGGINQTLHRISVYYTTNVKCIAPFNENDIKLETFVIISETLIVGKVPDIALSPSR